MDTETLKPNFAENAAKTADHVVLAKSESIAAEALLAIRNQGLQQAYNIANAAEMSFRKSLAELLERPIEDGYRIIPEQGRPEAIEFQKIDRNAKV